MDVYRGKIRAALEGVGEDVVEGWPLWEVRRGKRRYLERMRGRGGEGEE